MKPFQHSVTYVDVTVSVPTMVSVGEGDGTVQVCATLTAIEDTERNFTIMLATSSLEGNQLYAAVSGSDYVNTSVDIIFPSGSINMFTSCSGITIVDDAVLEGNQTFTVRLITLDPDVMLGNSITTVTIVDNDG